MQKFTVGSWIAFGLLVVVALVVVFGTQPAQAQTCPPALNMLVDGRLHGDHAHLIVTNIDGQPHGPYSAQVWITPTYEISETFSVPALQPHAQYTKIYTAAPFLETHAYFHWNYAGCPVWPALFYRAWMNAYSGYINQPGGDDMMMFQEDAVLLGEGY